MVVCEVKRLCCSLSLSPSLSLDPLALVSLFIHRSLSLSLWVCPGPLWVLSEPSEPPKVMVAAGSPAHSWVTPKQLG